MNRYIRSRNHLDGSSFYLKQYHGLPISALLLIFAFTTVVIACNEYDEYGGEGEKCYLDSSCNEGLQCINGNCTATDGDAEEDSEGNSSPGDIDYDMDSPNFGCDGNFSYEDLSGLWTMRFSIAYTSVYPIFGKVQMVMSGVARLQAEHDGNDFTFTEQICSFDMDVVEDKDFQVIFPDVAIQSFPVNPRHASISALEKGGEFLTTPPALDLYGVDASMYDDPRYDPLPTDAEAPEVVDFENDGKPGLTARINGAVQGEVYVVMRFWRVLDGALVCPGKMEGATRSEVEMVTLDADPWVLDVQLDLQYMDNPDLHRFEGVKLSEDLSCEELVARQDEFFTYNPMDYAVPLDEADGDR